MQKHTKRQVKDNFKKDGISDICHHCFCAISGVTIIQDSGAREIWKQNWGDSKTYLFWIVKGFLWKTFRQIWL